MKPLAIIAIAVLGLAIGLVSCSKEKATEAPKQEYVTKNLTPSKTEVKGTDFQIQVDGLQVSMNVDTATKEPVATPSLTGNYKIINTSKDVLDVQGVTVEYLDEQGKVIAFSSGEKIAKASLMLNKINPG
jgi:PBP1b-binding outer membrane lipoprotein LpoB